MNAAFCLKVAGEPAHGELIQFPGLNHSNNGYKGMEEDVFPIKKPEQLKAMCNWLKENVAPCYTVAFVLGINLGLRANELLALRWSDVRNADGTIKGSRDTEDTTDCIRVYQSKTGKVRGLYLNKPCVEVLEWFAGVQEIDSDLIFAGRQTKKTGNPISVGMLRKQLKRAAEACGIEQNIGTHTLRKTFGYFHYKANPCDIQLLQQMFGHSSESITLRYIGITEENRKAAYHAVELDCF